MATKKTDFNFEASLAKLESLVTRMEEGDMTLEESLKAFEEGVKLTRLCQETLGSAQQKVQLLMQQQGKTSLKEMKFENNETEDDD
jgi:exodeoxyribonuclease VII small subunit